MEKIFEKKKKKNKQKMEMVDHYLKT